MVLRTLFSCPQQDFQNTSNKVRFKNQEQKLEYDNCKSKNPKIVCQDCSRITCGKDECACKDSRQSIAEIIQSTSNNVYILVGKNAVYVEKRTTSS